MSTPAKPSPSLDERGNTFITVKPPSGSPQWHVTISLLDKGDYRVEYHDAARTIHQVDTSDDIDDIDEIAEQATIWLAGTCRHHGQ